MGAAVGSSVRELQWMPGWERHGSGAIACACQVGSGVGPRELQWVPGCWGVTWESYSGWESYSRCWERRGSGAIVRARVGAAWGLESYSGCWGARSGMNFEVEFGEKPFCVVS